MPLDDTDKAAIAKMVADALQANNEELGKRFVAPDAAQKMVQQGLAEGLKAAGIDKVGETLSGLTSKLEELGKGSGDSDGKKKGGDTPDPELARVKEQLTQLEQRNRQAEEARQKAEQRARTSTLHGQIREALGKLDIPADRHDLVIPVLERMTAGDGKPVLRFNDAGEPVFVAQRNGYVDTLTVKDGIAEWGQTDTAKVYLPPKGQGGTGGGAGGDERHRNAGTAPRDSNGNTDWGALESSVSIDPAQLAAG